MATMQGVIRFKMQVELQFKCLPQFET